MQDQEDPIVSKVIKKRPMKQYLSDERITDILHSRFNLNLTDKEVSYKHNISMTLARRIIKKYGAAYVESNKLYTELPDIDTLKEHWISS